MPFVFGIADQPELPGVVLNRLLVDLGLSPAAAKALLARMRQREQLAARRDGRRSLYRLAGAFARSFQRIRSGPFATGPTWDGEFHSLLYQVPETERAFRDLLRRNALLVGYGLLQQGVLIAPADHTDALAATLARRPESATVYPARLRLGIADARVAAAQAWALRDVEQVLLGHCRQLADALATAPEEIKPSAHTLRRLAEIINAPLVDTLLAPRLPAELLPEHWPVLRLYQLISEVNEHYLPPAAAYVRELLADH